jgi:hypothetical protein
VASSQQRQLDLAYRRTLEAARQQVIAALELEFDDAIDPNDIAASFDAFVERATAHVEQGQVAAQQLATAYLALAIEDAGAVDDLVPEDDSIPGTTRAGKTLVDGLAPFGSMALAAIANGAPAGDAIAFAKTLVTGFADREVTAAADRKTERQSQASDAIVGWEGIVQPGACDNCQANAGPHDLADEFWRHNDCNCTRLVLFASA